MEVLQQQCMKNRNRSTSVIPVLPVYEKRKLWHQCSKFSTNLHIGAITGTPILGRMKLGHQHNTNKTIAIVNKQNGAAPMLKLHHVFSCGNQNGTATVTAAVVVAATRATTCLAFTAEVKKSVSILKMRCGKFEMLV